MNKKISVIILAAGKGTRMKSKKPKVLHEIGNKPMIMHLIDKCNELKIKNISVITSSKNSDIKYLLPKRTNIIVQKDQIGTANAILAAKKYFSTYNGNLLVLYSDVPLIKKDTLKKLIKSSLKNPSLLYFQTKTPQNYGRVISENNLIRDIVEEKNANIDEKKIDQCNSGIFCCNASLMFDLIGKIKKDKKYDEYLLTNIFKISFKENLPFKKIKVPEKEVIGVNNKKQLADAEKIFQATQREKFFNKGVTFLSPKTTFLSYDTEIGMDTRIGANVYFGKGVKIESNVEISNNCNIAETTIHEGASLGPLCRIRNNSIICKNVKIGNFVEIKNSSIGMHSKVSHLSYIGDSSIGKRTNIGAGTITCNYDGKKKHRTIIGDNVFVGSNCSLIAPIKIGDNAFVAAGSTISKNVGKNDFSISRTAQKIIKNGRKKFIN